MALIVCKDCNKEFSTDAKQCPHCGANKVMPPKSAKPPSKIVKYGLWFIGGVMLLMFAAIPKAPAPSSVDPIQEKREKDLDLAKFMCRKLIEKQLNDQASVIYESQYPASDYGAFVHHKKYKTEFVEVQTAFRARNAFGAYVRNVMQCDYTYINGNLMPISVAQVRN